MGLNKPNKAVAAWGVLKRIGVSPSLKTWNAMLDGCKKAHNVRGLRNVWAKLVSTGMELDTAVWTTRVAGLVECGDLEGGLQVLDEMVKVYNKDSGNSRRRPVKPTIEPVNAALVGLIRNNKFGAAVDRLLAWAASNGLEPDIFTFNTLLRPMIRKDLREDVQRLFERMRQQGVQADAATFTIVLDAALSRITPPARSARSREEAREAAQKFERAQQETVALVLSRMQAAGLETNLHTYGKMIYLLLQSGGDRSSEAVKAVLAHLWSQGHELSPHIYTMLVEHYFGRHPPDLAAVDSLLERRRVLTGGALEMDRIFYDRVVRGYAVQADQPSTALAWYYRLSNHGYLIEPNTRAELLRALIMHGLRDDARSLVRDARDRLEERHGIPAGGAGAGANTDDLSNDDDEADRVFWQNNFWAMAEDYGLVEHGTLNNGAGDSEARGEGSQ